MNKLKSQRIARGAVPQRVRDLRVLADAPQSDIARCSESAMQRKRAGAMRYNRVMISQLRARRSRRIAFCAVAISSAVSGCASPKSMNVYSQKVRYAKDRDLKFSDFALRYLGQHKVIPPQYPRGFILYDFRVTGGGGKTQKISWSSGTGLIDWTDFSVGEKKFGLELQASVVLGKLAPDELVVSPLETLTGATQSKAVR